MSDAEEVEVEKHIPVQMTAEHIKSGLSQIGKTFDGSSVSYIKLDLENKELDIPSPLLSNYKHLRYMNLSNNHFENLEVLSNLPFLIKLDLKGNRLVTGLSLFEDASKFQYLQYLDLSKNGIQVLTGIALPKLETLKLSFNQIAKIENFSGHSSLRSLELRGNKLVSLENLHNLTNLEELFLAENGLTSLAGIVNAPNLKKIHARKNTLAGFENKTLPHLPSLTYLNFRENEVVEMKDVGNLAGFAGLQKIVVADNPLKPEPSGDVKKEILIVLPGLKFIGKEEVTAEEREDAVGEAAERRRLAEEARIEAERAAKEAMENAEDKPEGTGEAEEGEE